MPLAERRFPPPWSIEELDACFIMIDGAGQKSAFVYFEDETGRRTGGDDWDQFEFGFCVECSFSQSFIMASCTSWAIITIR